MSENDDFQKGFYGHGLGATNNSAAHRRGVFWGDFVNNTNNSGWFPGNNKTSSTSPSPTGRPLSWAGIAGVIAVGYLVFGRETHVPKPPVAPTTQKTPKAASPTIANVTLKVDYSFQGVGLKECTIPKGTTLPYKKLYQRADGNVDALVVVKTLCPQYPPMHIPNVAPNPILKVERGTSVGYTEPTRNNAQYVQPAAYSFV